LAHPEHFFRTIWYKAVKSVQNGYMALTLLVFYVYLEYNKTDYIHTEVLVKE